jgi:hypothetical protein
MQMYCCFVSFYLCILFADVSFFSRPITFGLVVDLFVYLFDCLFIIDRLVGCLLCSSFDHVLSVCLFVCYLFWSFVCLLACSVYCMFAPLIFQIVCVVCFFSLVLFIVCCFVVFCPLVMFFCVYSLVCAFINCFVGSLCLFVC